MAAALSSNAILPERVHLERAVFLKASLTQGVIEHLQGAQKPQERNESCISPIHFALVAMLRSFSDLQKRNHLTIQGTESEKQANKSLYIRQFSGMPFRAPIHLL
jgi:hypothetical protein